MKIPMLIEPSFESSYWCTQALKGVKKQTYNKKIDLVTLTEEEVMDYHFTSNQRVVLIVASTLDWIDYIVTRLSNSGIMTLLVSSDYSSRDRNKTSCVQLNYLACMNTIMSYLHTLGDQNIALYGINPNSYSDRTKKSAFPNKDDIYYNFGSAETCALQLFKNIDKYDSIICANDAVAIHLLHFLREKDISIISTHNVISFGDFLLSRLMKPALTSISLDYYLLGQQAVDTFIFLNKSMNPITVNVLLDCKLNVRDTTTQRKEHATVITQALEDEHNIDFYGDHSIAPIMSLEKLLMSADRIDLQILCCEFKSYTQEKTAEELNISVSALRYRSKHLLSFLPVKSTKELRGYISNYLTYDDLQKAMERVK